jgi:hypothetical protein
MPPSLPFLASVERAFSVVFPEAFQSFCRRHEAESAIARYPGLRRGSFITDMETLQAINRQIGSEEWGDYERIIAGREHPKSGERLWGGLLPFFFESKRRRKQRRGSKLAVLIYGFPTDDPGSSKVLVWSVHCVVNAYPTFDAWLDTYNK